MFSATLRCGKSAYDWNTVVGPPARRQQRGGVLISDVNAPRIHGLQPRDQPQRRLLQPDALSSTTGFQPVFSF